jgi:NAD/NADP transhydrogenase alpha subunit
MSSDAIMADGNVTITTTLAIVNGVSYPTNTISAISVREIPPGMGWLGWVIGLGIVALVLIANNQIAGALVFAAIAGLVVYLRPKTSYNLMVRSAGADTSVLTSKDAAYLGSVKSAIEEAVRRRG